ncbi:hypothetical protein [Microbacterium sulfonylureivorans]|uniref:hypothetical protein n=1 Tax=Microbacterium sulfonylureivorans TaxID=2486854 RepID=UPI000FD82398|nr:hypothetical protein [Microbacterium sulfonylureivorans]
MENSAGENHETLGAESVTVVDAEREAATSDSDDEIRELSRDDRFRFVGQEFRDAIEALRETHDELAPAASDLDSLTKVWDGTVEESKRLTKEDRALLVPVFQNLPDEGLSANELLDRLWDAIKDTDWGPGLMYHFVRRVYRPRRQPIFHNAMLISAVAAFESHLAKLAEEYYRAAPEALHKLPKEATKEFSLRELQALGSLEDAIELAIERRVTELMFGSLSDWKKFYSERMNIDMAELCGAWDNIHEIFERRHCIVHSEARASRRYIRTNPKAQLREPLDTDAQYVQDALDGLELLGILLQTAVWAKFALDKQEVIDASEVVAFDSLKASRWQFSYRLYEHWQNLPLSEAEQRMARVNLWIARKNLHGLASIRKEVTEWDVSGSDEIYDFAKLCLLEELEAAFAMLPVMIERDKIGGKGVATWPLLAPLREDPRIQDYADIMRDYLSEEADITIENAESDARLTARPEAGPEELLPDPDDTSGGSEPSDPPQTSRMS